MRHQKYYKVIFSILVIFLTVSCGFEKDGFIEVYSEKKPIFSFSGSQSFLIIPDIGCSGCIYQSQEFMKKHVDTPNFYFVITSLYSDTKYKFENLVKRTDKVFFDYENTFLDHQIVDSYPLLLNYNDSDLVYRNFIKPTDGKALENFEKQCLSKSLK